MMSQAELLKLVIEVLGQLQIDSMLVGSIVSSFYGEARTTHDIDLLINLPPQKIDSLVARFSPPRYYLSSAALREGRMANLIDTQSGDKVDLWILSDDRIAQEEFSRRKPAEILDTQVFIATAEDIVVSKLRWSKQTGGSQQQRSDVRELLRRQDNLDFDFINKAIEEQDLRREWTMINGDSFNRQ